MLAGLALAAQAGGAGFAAAAAARPSIEPIAIGSSGQELPVDPVLLRGHQIVVRADGFAARATVAVRLAGTTRTSYAVADPNGVLTVRYTIEPTLPNGAYVLTLVGAPGAPTSGTPQERDAPPTRDDQPFVFLVPRVWLFHFRVASSTGTGHPSGGHGGGGVAYTGVDVAALLALAVVVIAIGVLILRTARRPETGETTQDGTGGEERP